MPVLNPRALIIGLMMILSSGIAVVMKPVERVADAGPKIDLESMIPKQFSDWRIDNSLVPLEVDPRRLAVLNRIYNQTLSRTYINHKGERIMLSIAYGGDQSDSMQVHKPEICYPGQGFKILKLVAGMFDTGFGEIEVKRLLATQGSRIEPITYWITIGDTVTVNSLKWKLAQLKYGLTGKVPDGLLFRVSSLGDEATGYVLQEDFTRLLLRALSPKDRTRLIGSAAL